MEALEFAQIVSELEALNIASRRVKKSLIYRGFDYRLEAIEEGIQEIKEVFNFDNFDNIVKENENADYE